MARSGNARQCARTRARTPARSCAATRDTVSDTVRSRNAHGSLRRQLNGFSSTFLVVTRQWDALVKNLREKKKRNTKVLTRLVYVDRTQTTAATGR